MFRFLRAIPMRALSPLSLATAVVPLLLTLVEHAPAVIHALRALPGAIAQHVRHHAQRSHAHLHAQAKARYSRKHATAISASVVEHLSLSDHIALGITNAVGTLTCAALFTALALVSLPAALSTRDPVIIVAWIAQTLLQLVLLSVILAGQNLSSKHSELLAEADYAVNQRAEAEAQQILSTLAQLAAQVQQMAERPQPACLSTGAPPATPTAPRRPRHAHPAVADTKE